MSYILDALKKSERERALVRGVGFADAARQVMRRTDWLPWLISGVAVFALAVAVLAFLLRDRLATPNASPAAPVAQAPVTVAANSVDVPVATDVVDQVVRADAVVQQAPAAARTAAQDLAEQAPAAPLAEAKVEAPPPATTVDVPAKFLVDMPPEFQQIVPAMAVNIHVYVPDESQRILYINNQQYYRGDEIAGGVTVEEIVPEGVVLRFRGQRFKLPRPS